MNLVTKISYAATIRAMEPGHTMYVSMDEFSPTSASNLCSRLNKEHGCRYSVHRDYDTRTLTITRVA